MAITQPHRANNKQLSGFNGKAHKKGRNGRMADFFTSKKSSNSKYDLKDEFASRSRKKGRFRTYDEFATRKKRANRYRDFDEFAYRSSKRSLFTDKHEFATRSKKTRKVNISSKFDARIIAVGFKKVKKRNSNKGKRKRGQQSQQQYTPFASSISPFAMPTSHREPQVGLWGGSIGRWSGKDKRAMIPLPEPEKKDD